MSAPIPEQLLSPQLGHLVELFTIDPTPINAGAAVFYVTPQTEAAGGGTFAPTVTRGGQAYYGAPIDGEGFERGGEGAMAQPVVRVANVSNLLSPWVWNAEDMLGAKITRLVVLEQWLDGEPQADATAYITQDVYFIEQKTRHDHEGIEWRLRAATDRSDQRLPARLALPTCQLRYRVWDGAAFDYTAATCPYTGGSVFDYLDNGTSNALDQCSKTVTGCKLRFPAQALPMSGFPGLGRR